MDGFDGIFDTLGDAIAGALTGGDAEARGRDRDVSAGRNPDGTPSATATYDRTLTGARPILNINDQ
jgi:hypothetical protein